MSDTPNTGETANQPATPTQTPSAPPVVKPQESSVEEVRKQLEEERKAREQAQMRANQLENEKKQRDDAEAARQAKELEEQNQYKELYEQEKTKREEVERERQEAEAKKEIEAAKAEVEKEYDEAVVNEAKELGFDLANADEATVAAYKAKLDKLSTIAGKTQKVTGNNPPAPSNNKPQLNREEIAEALGTDQGFHDFVTKNYPGIAAMTQPKS